MRCTYFDCEVQLEPLIEQHIIDRHPELLPNQVSLIERVLVTPELIPRSSRSKSVYLFSAWFPNLYKGKFVVVVIGKDTNRCWVITAYAARKISGGEILWNQQI